MLEELYQKVILEHYCRPRNRGRISSPDFSAHDNNPLCGDEVTIFLKMNQDVIGEVKFDGAGCSISQASASILTTVLVGKTIQQANKTIDDFLAAMKNRRFNESIEGDARSLEGVLKFPVRIKCANLPWRTAQKAMRIEDVCENP